jgi:hypothetical protein
MKGKAREARVVGRDKNATKKGDLRKSGERRRRGDTKDEKWN